MTSTGHEEEFRRLFEMEAQTRLSALADQALELEARGADRDLVDAMYRNAHTLKGGAGVVGLKDIADVVHGLEQLLDDLRSGRREASTPVADAVLGAVDALRDMIARTIEGRKADEAAARARAALAGADAPTGAPAGETPPAAGRPAVELAVTAPGRLEGRGRDEPPARHRPDARDAIPVPVGRLDELVRLVGESAGAQLRVGRLLAERLGEEPAAIDEYRNLARLIDQLQAQAMRARMVSVGTVTAPLRRAARDLAHQAGKRVAFEVAGEDTELDRHVLERLRDSLVALVRNAVDHGIEPTSVREAAGKSPEGRVMVHAMQVGSEVIVTVSDDGRGIDHDRVARALGAGHALSRDETLAAIFRPGISTAEALTGVSGRGVGLDEVRAAVADVRGRVEVHSVPGEGTEFRISVPMTLAILRCLLVEAGGQRFAVPLHACIALLGPDDADAVHAEGRPAVWVSDDAVAQSPLTAVLELEGPDPQGPVVVLSVPHGRHAFRVDRLLGQRDVVIKDLGRVLPRVDVLAGASVEADGAVLLVLDAGGLIDAAGTGAGAAGPAAREATGAVEAAADAPGLPPGRAVVLVVDDALTIRELQRSILERAGYDVVTAASGAEALDRLASGDVDLVLTDVEMPEMDGFELTERIRTAPAGRNVPVIILTSRAGDADRRRGLEAGADGYLLKASFDEHALLTAVARLLGRPGGRS